MKKLYSLILILVIALCWYAFAENDSLIGEWTGAIFGLPVTLTINDDGTYTITLANYPDAEARAGTWVASENAVIFDKDTIGETIYTIGNDSICSSDNSIQYTKLNSSSTGGMVSDIDIPDKKYTYSLDDYSGTWITHTIELDGHTGNLDDYEDADLYIIIFGTYVSMSNSPFEKEFMEFTFTDNCTLEFIDGQTPIIFISLDGDESHRRLTYRIGRDNEYIFTAECTRPFDYSDNIDHLDDYNVLERGSKGEEVVRLQKRLIELNYLNGSADGDYGKKTRSAVQLFQNSAGFLPTGTADKLTQTALFSSSAPVARLYKNINFDEMSRNPDQYLGNPYVFTGRVVQVLEEEYPDFTDVGLRISTVYGYGNVVYVTYKRLNGESRILEDDNVTIYGEYLGVSSYKGVLGNTITLPTFDAESIIVG